MSVHRTECRFCLKILDVNKKSTAINEEIKSQFENVTQMQLIESDKYSQVVCEICLRSLHLAYAVKEEFCEIQKKLQDEIKKESQTAFEAEATASSSINVINVIEHPCSRKRSFESMTREETNEELSTIIKIENDHVVQIIDHTNADLCEEQQSSDCDDTVVQKRTVSWNFTTKKVMHLRKEEKQFWQNIVDKIGAINPTVLYILQMNGYNNVFSFQGHFEAGVDNTETIKLLEESVRVLDKNSQHLNSIDFAGRAINEFAFNLGQQCSIFGIFEEIRKLVQTGNLKVEFGPTTKLDDLQHIVEETLRRRLKRKTLDFPIYKSSLKQFPYTLWIPCFRCQRLEQVTVAEIAKTNGEKRLNVRTLSYVKHVEEECKHGT